jgi:hypothetical protein
VKDSKKDGSKFLSLKATPAQEKEREREPPPEDDDVPF